MSFKQKFSSIAKPIGFVLIAISTIAWLTVFTIPFLEFDILEIAGIITALIILGEVAFYLGILCLGKTYWEKIKSFLLDKLQAAKNDSKVQEDKT
jgi:hypothetical protein